MFTSPVGWPGQGHVKVEALSVRYRDGLDLVLKGISFEIQPGEKVRGHLYFLFADIWFYKPQELYCMLLIYLASFFYTSDFSLV